jgi:uncharacterized LabA/DUF88 family protein
MAEAAMRTNIYIDGFNLYYAIRDTPYRWLDLGRMCQHLLQGHTINRIRYFTARVAAEPADPTKPQRQEVYLRALRTIPHLTIHLGHFLTSQRWMPLAAPPGRPIAATPGIVGPHPKTGIPMARVIKTEEKGSDVNIASYLLLDGFQRDYELAAIISNDSDLITPIQLTQATLGLSVGVFNPHTIPSHALRRAAAFYRPIRTGVLQASQFPASLTTLQGVITKPLNW